MIRTLFILLVHDFAVAFKNKTLYLIIGIPLFVFATLRMVDPAAGRTAPVKIALLEGESYPPLVLESLASADGLFDVQWVGGHEEAMRRLNAREVEGLLAPDHVQPARLQLTVVQQASTETLTILQRLSTLQAAAEGRGPGWIVGVQSLQASSIERQTLPTWILMMVLMVGFIVLPAQVAEEKEKQLLLGWLQTPVREGAWLAAKLAYGIGLMLLSVATLQWTGGDAPWTHGLAYLAILCAGGFCFGSLGLLLGLLCRSQASARTLGVLCYLPLLLPAALSDMSQSLRRVAPLIPSHQFYEPLRALLLEDVVIAAFPRACISLLLIGLLACFASHGLLRKRWLMG